MNDSRSTLPHRRPVNLAKLSCDVHAEIEPGKYVVLAQRIPGDLAEPILIALKNTGRFLSLTAWTTRGRRRYIEKSVVSCHRSVPDGTWWLIGSELNVFTPRRLT